jgi:hypothetical protein
VSRRRRSMSAMSRRSVPRGLVLSIAFFGVFVGHALTYVVLAGNPIVRSMMLQATGHRYLPVAVDAARAVAVIGLAGVLIAGLSGAETSRARLAHRIVTFQVLTFAAIEVAERVAAHAPLRDLTHVLPVGTVVQIGVALVVAAVIRVALRAADIAAEASSGPAPRPQPAIVPLIATSSTWTPVLRRGARRDRAPPR